MLSKQKCGVSLGSRLYERRTNNNYRDKLWGGINYVTHVKGMG